MPVSLNKYRIKDLPAIVQEADLVNKVFEVETPSGTDQNYKVSFPTVVQTVANNLPGGNNAKVAVKTARIYSPQTPGYDPSSTTLTGMNPDFLCLFTTCWVEFPHPTTEYILVYDGTPGAPLQVWRDGTFTGQKIGAKWVPVNSVEARVQGIEDFSPFVGSYALGDNVKYTLGGSLRLFSARRELVKTTFTPAQIPPPTGSANDPNWVEINGNDGVIVGDFLPGAYQRHELVVFEHKLYRAKEDLNVGDFQSQPGVYDNFPDLDVWELVSGSGSASYNDAPLTARVVALEYSLDYVATTVGDNYNEFNTRINGIVSTAPDYAPGSFSKGQFVTSSGKVFIAKQAMQNSTVAPTVTNAYWLQVSGGGGVAVQNSLSPGSSTDAPSIDAVNDALGNLSTAVGSISASIKIGYAPNPAQAPVTVGGLQNNVTGLESAAVGGGRIDIYGNDSGAVAGSQITIYGNNSGSVGGGYSHVTGDFSGQVGGYSCFGKGNYSAIIGGIGLSLPIGADYSAIIAGRNFTAPVQSDTVYMPQVHLFENGGGISLVSPDGMTRKTIALNNAGEATLDGVTLGTGSGPTTTSGTSVDYTNPTTLSANTTLTATDFGKHFKLAANATGALNTLTLPPISGNVNKLISVVVDNACAGMWAIQGDSIDGETERRLWKAESAVLQCTNNGWTKIAGKTVPMMFVASMSNSNSINGSIGTFLFDTTVDGTSAPANMFDPAVYAIYALRKGKYQPAMLAYLTGSVQQRPIEVFMAKNGNVYHAETTNSPAPVTAGGNGAFYASVCTPPVPVKLNTGEYMTAMYYSDNSYYVNSGGAIFPKFSLTELPTW